MGMDSIEILMKVEDSFGIKIPKGEAEQILTVGDFHDAVWRHLYGKYSERCKSQGLFYKLRKLIGEIFKFPSQQLQLDTSPNEVFPKQNRREAYFVFSQSINLKLPELVLTRPWAAVLNAFGFVAILGGLISSIVLINFFNYSKWILFIPVLGIALTIFLSNLFEPKRTVIKASTIKTFTEQILAMNYASLMIEQGTNRREMEMVINHYYRRYGGARLRRSNAREENC